MQVPSFLSHSLLVQPELHRFVQSSPQYFGSHAKTNITRVLSVEKKSDNVRTNSYNARLLLSDY